MCSSDLKSITAKVNKALEAREPLKKSVTLYLNRKNYELLRTKCEAIAKKSKSKVVPSDVIDELIVLYLEGDA